MTFRVFDQGLRVPVGADPEANTPEHHTTVARPSAVHGCTEGAFALIVQCCSPRRNCWWNARASALCTPRRFIV